MILFGKKVRRLNKLLVIAQTNPHLLEVFSVGVTNLSETRNKQDAGI